MADATVVSVVDRLPLLRVRGISKRFGSVQALREMDFDLRHGEVHVLFGENGAGKSTLINVIAGAIAPDTGTLSVEGKDVAFASVHHARRYGIAAMFQEFSLAPHMTVEENVMLGVEPRIGIWLKKARRREIVSDALRKCGFTIDLRREVASLSRAEQQMVEMTKALLIQPRILILDEPTASLSEQETEVMFGLVRSLRERNVGIIYITHRINEIRRIGDRVTVMRDGRVVSTVPVSTVENNELVELMTGRSFEEFYPAIEHKPGPVLLEVSGLACGEGRIRDIALSARGGELVGIAGLVGSGKSEIGRAIFGLLPTEQGTVTIGGKDAGQRTPRRMMASGLSYITSDRRAEGLMLQRSTKENITVASLGQPEISRFSWLRLGNERAFARKLGERMRVRPLDLARTVDKYSGGNQQKIMIAKSLGGQTRVFIFDEPTVGIDVSARVEVYGFIKEAVESGAAVIVISSDLPEVLNLSHRLYVVRDGQIVDQMSKTEISESRVLHGFFGTEAEPRQHLGG